MLEISILYLLKDAMKHDENSDRALALGDREAVRALIDRIRQHRLRHNWSQAEMARRAGLSRPTYQNFENGYGNITLGNLVKVLGILGFTRNLAELVPSPEEELTYAALTKPARQRARARRATASKAKPLA